MGDSMNLRQSARGQYTGISWPLVVGAIGVVAMGIVLLASRAVERAEIKPKPEAPTTVGPLIQNPELAGYTAVITVCIGLCIGLLVRLRGVDSA